ncbi:MAG TPA: glycosyltransferase family 2 protein [Blastocatellia bacterium]|nr:glycosyltransferase family 2 protein [Blastocatellia bacterium]
MNRITIASPREAFFSGRVLQETIESLATDYLLLQLPGGVIDYSERSLARMVQVADDAGAGIVYADFRDRQGDEISDHPLIDYQAGSIRDTFDFGSLVLVSRRAAQQSLVRDGRIPEDVKYGGWYDLRLKLSLAAPVVRVPEPLYTRSVTDTRATGEKQFDYVDPRQRDYQIEMERLATDHLKRIGAYLEPQFTAVPATAARFPVRASVIIPVRNRVRTIADAVRSALSQQAGFDFNVIVVDNHSTDGTTDALRELAAADSRLVHLIPARTDLGIGGCWNEAVFSSHCGRYAVQLDSDDIYQNEQTLARIIAEFDQGGYALVIGSYTLVDFELNELPPGLIDHREWTRENGRNNALRINGLGAPRAFDVTVLREYGLPNTSYGEDYAIALRLSRDYEIGRIYDSVYLCRRWGGNSDSALPLATMNRYDYYKDWLRTQEIRARQRRNAK